MDISTFKEITELDKNFQILHVFTVKMTRFMLELKVAQCMFLTLKMVSLSRRFHSRKLILRAKDYI
jgi:hypothetical protein